MIELNEVGEAYLAVVIKQMKDLEIYLEGDEEIMLKDMSIQYQLYNEELELSTEPGIPLEERKNHHMNSTRHLKIVQDMQKQSGLSALQRHKLKAFKEIQEENKSIQDIIADEMRD